MIWCRFQNGSTISYGLVEGDRVAEVLGSPLGEYRATGNSYPLSQVKLLV